MVVDMRGRVYRSEHAARTAEGSGPPGETGSAAGHSAVMALGSLVSRATGFLRTVIIGAALGSTLVGNAYTTAQWFPGMVYELLLGGILTSVLVPSLVRARKSDPDRGEAYTQRLVTLAVLALSVTTVVAVVCAPLLTWISRTDAPGLVTTWSYLILPTIFFYGLAGVLMAVLNTRGHFAAPMWAPILNNLVVIVTFALYLLIFGAERLDPAQMDGGRIALVGGGTLLGIVVQAAGLIPALRGVGFRMRWRFDFAALRLRELGRLGVWMFVYVGSNQVGVLVVLSLINGAGAEAGLLIFNLVFLLLMMAHGIVGVSIIVALMPRMSAAAADRRYEDLVDDVTRGARMAAAVLAPVAVVYVVLAQPLSTTLFQWGVFNADAARATAPVLLMAGLALIPFSIGQLATFAHYALSDTRTPALVNIGTVLVRIGVQLAIFVAFAASFVAAGMMLGNAVSYVFAALVMGGLLQRRLGSLRLAEVAISLGKVLVAAAGAALAGWIMVTLLPGGDEPSKLEALAELVVGGLAVAGAYLGLAVVLRIAEVNEVLDLVRRKLPTRRRPQ
jgi:putative peptidoglycan lipid II flippase